MRRTAKTFPPIGRQQSQPDEKELAHHEQHEPFERRVGEAVAVQPDAEHIYAGLCEGGFVDLIESCKEFRSAVTPTNTQINRSVVIEMISPIGLSCGLSE